MIDLIAMRRAEVIRVAQEKLDDQIRKNAALVALARRDRDRATGRTIDSSMSKSSIQNARAITKQTEIERITLREIAESNPMLRRALINLSKRGILV